MLLPGRAAPPERPAADRRACQRKWESHIGLRLACRRLCSAGNSDARRSRAAASPTSMEPRSTGRRRAAGESSMSRRSSSRSPTVSGRSPLAWSQSSLVARISWPASTGRRTPSCFRQARSDRSRSSTGRWTPACRARNVQRPHRRRAIASTGLIRPQRPPPLPRVVLATRIDQARSQNSRKGALAPRRQRFGAPRGEDRQAGHATVDAGQPRA